MEFGFYNGILTVIKEKGPVTAKLTTTTLAKLPKYLGLGEVVKTTTQYVVLGKGYQECVEARLAQKGLDTTSFKSEGLPWGHWSIYPLFIENKGLTYLRVTMTDGYHTTSYMVDGREATEDEVATIKSYNEAKYSKKQSKCGLEGKEQVRVLCYPIDCVDNIEIVDEVKKVG